MSVIMECPIQAKYNLISNECDPVCKHKEIYYPIPYTNEEINTWHRFPGSVSLVSRLKKVT